MPVTSNRRYTDRILHLVGILALAGMIISTSSCSFSYRQETAAEAVEHPDYILMDTVYTISRLEFNDITFSAQRAEFYTQKNLVTLEDVGFTQTDADGSLLTEGTADTASINTDTLFAELSGDVRLLSLTEDLSIRSESLFWDHENQKLTAGDELVEIIYSDGSSVSGRGFTADGAAGTFEFAQSAEGVVRYE
jgi:LPS export ABC transporter protein LptC